MIQDIFLKLNWPDWLFTIEILVLFVISYFFYFRTLPPLSRKRRIPALLLRGTTLTILAFLLMEPILQLLYQFREKPVIAALFDNSASMKIKESYGQRGDSLYAVFKRVKSFTSSDSLEIATFKFDVSSALWEGDSLSFNVDGSNLDQAITAVLDSLSGKNVQAIVLVSDGVYNQGANPLLTAQKTPIPIYTVLIGDSSVPKDISIRRAQTNQITYVNKKLPLEVVLWQNGFDGQTALLSVSSGGRSLSRKMVTFGKSGLEQKVELELVAREAGDFNYTVEIQPLENEITELNNTQTVRVRVLKSKINVLVMSGSPNFDRRFLSYLADQLKDYRFTFLTEKTSGQYYEASFSELSLDSMDLFIFHGYPTRNSNPEELRKLLRSVREFHVPVFWMINQDLYLPKLTAFKSFLPFPLVAGLSRMENQFVKLTGSGRLHPITRLDDNESANDLLWRELPPIETYPQITMREGGQLLLTTDVASENQRLAPLPVNVCFVYRQSEIKQLVFNGANWGNWHYQLQENPAREDFAVKLMDRAIRWLVNRDDIHQVQIRPLQPIYNVGEPVVFSGQVYDEFYQPLSDAQVVVSVTRDTSRFSDEMIVEGGGYYRQAFSGLAEGEYQYRIEARRNEKQIGTRNGQFTVKPFFLEYQDIPANYSLMQQLAEQSGGIAYTPAEFIRKFPNIKLEARTQYAFSEYFLWSYWYWLVGIIWLLGSEWFLRKRWGLL